MGPSAAKIAIAPVHQGVSFGTKNRPFEIKGLPVPKVNLACSVNQE
jgi:hypothetical protein